VETGCDLRECASKREPGVDKGCLTAWDVDLFAAFCVSVAQYNELRRLVQKHGVIGPGSQDQPVVSPYLRAQGMALEAMLKLSARFGLSPADRAGLVVAPPGDVPDLGPARLLT
jgi:P27 family predicted phage terminase small subunit